MPTPSKPIDDYGAIGAIRELAVTFCDAAEKFEQDLKKVKSAPDITWSAVSEDCLKNTVKGAEAAVKAADKLFTQVDALYKKAGKAMGSHPDHYASAYEDPCSWKA